MPANDRPAAGPGEAAPADAPVAPPAAKRRAGTPERRRRSPLLAAILVLLSIHMLVWAWAFFLPFTLSLMFYFLFMPVVRALRRVGVTEWVGAALVVLVACAVLVAGAYAVSWPAADWLSRAPEGLERLERSLRGLFAPLQQVSETAERVEQLATGEQPRGPRARGAGAASSVTGTLLGDARELLDGVIVVSALVYFLLASGDMFLRKLVKVMPTFRDKVRAVEIARDIEHQMSAYLTSHTLLNIGFGALTGVTVWLLGMPNPLLWAVVAALTNYVPVLGAVFAGLAIGLAALMTFDDPGRALLVPVVFVALNLIEGNIAYPLVVGKRMTLNAPMVFVALMFWLWAWGILGALLSVPILAAIKVFCEHIEGLQPIAEFLGEDDDKSAG